MTENFENWEETTQETKKELKAMRRKLRKRSWTIIFTSLILVAALLLAAAKLVIPAVEKQYWDPAQCSYLEDVTDLELTMAAYNALFGHGQQLIAVEAQKQGFASYSLDVIFAQWKTMHSATEVSFRTASLVEGELRYPKNFWNNEVLGSFIEEDTGENGRLIKQHNRRAAEYLRQLPEYVQVFASVTFTEDQTMQELRRLTDQYAEGAAFTWAVLRDGELHGAQCGVQLWNSSAYRYSPEAWNDLGYPKLFMESHDWRAEDMEKHINATLKFSDDQLKKGRGILPSGEDPEYYAKTLSYIEENGVKVYGSHVIATPQTLLKMIEDGVVSYIRLTDARIGLAL